MTSVKWHPAEMDLKILDVICQCSFELRAMQIYIIKICLFLFTWAKSELEVIFSSKTYIELNSVRQKKSYIKNK